MTDQKFLDGPGSNGDPSGSTATILIRNPEGIIVANVGDSRSVLCCENGKAKRLSVDHKVSNIDEMKMIQSKGGIVIRKDNNNYRLNGKLDVSRSIGDISYKKYITPIPSITMLNYDNEHKYAIIASDGVWDVISDSEAVEIVSRELTNPTIKVYDSQINKYQSAARMLAAEALVRGSTDNISVLVVNLERYK